MKNKLLGFVLRIVSLALIALIALSGSMGLPKVASILMLIVSFACFFLSTKLIR